MLKSVLSIRISVIAWCLLALFFILVFTIHQQKLTAGQLALFSVNSFLFGYYFSPLLSAQKARVAALITTARSEEMAILDILAQSHLLNAKDRHLLKVKLRVYLDSIVDNMAVRADNPFYDELLYFTKSVHGKDEQVMNVIYDRVSKTQANRDTLNNLFASRVYSHEWLVVLVLYGITLYFALQTNFNGSVFFGIMLAILCTGLSLLMVIMIKFATLTHKEAKRMWLPLKDLVKTHFDDVSDHEFVLERERIETGGRAK